MDLHRADDDVVADDPFWSVVRRRHPDLTVVLLPEEPPDDRPPTPPDEARARATRLAQAWAALAPVLAATGVPGVTVTPPSVRWAVRDDGEALVLDKALPGAGPELLAATALRLGERGWRLRPGSRGGAARLDATDGHLELTGRSGAAATTLSLAAPAVRLPDDVRREVRDGLVALVAGGAS
ncbi:hypothetical protein GUY44_22375 [Pimelobacter simplex]|uniref:Uncharacterized protein n=1 Tax=Nocardioides simplex TaxID=2045 RepID=A0A0A1DPQ6_NOCSI|nr:hypothetical protein [Pimelobacter simplex]AIY18577.1 hypothetical protein KR76_20710 [Pimelobacter simplex]MCG8153245.1 hypothetical protein [Pimelobacter simplex]GEB14217.1 hypothetical protein NSI01_25320 [Pimelobacter simplex]SFM32285.1 hypothetical protein SAMN05421671_1202 [Pimelobacter simplex]